MKKLTEEITCDKCEKDISPKITQYPNSYILKLSAVDIARHVPGNAIFAVLCYPPIKQDLYFCNLKCLIDFSRDTYA